MYLPAEIPLGDLGKATDDNMRVEWRRLFLIGEKVQHRNLALIVPMGDGQDGVIIAAARHVDRGEISDAVDRLQYLSAGDDRGLDLPLIVVGALRCARQIPVQATEARGRQAATLLFQIALAIWP